MDSREEVKIMDNVENKFVAVYFNGQVNRVMSNGTYSDQIYDTKEQALEYSIQEIEEQYDDEDQQQELKDSIRIYRLVKI